MDKYAGILEARLNDLDVAPYGAAQRIAKGDRRTAKTLHARITRYLENDPEPLLNWIEIIEALGGEINITWKD